MYVSIVDESVRDTWDEFVAGQQGGSFLQSWDWGEFQRTAGFTPTRVMVTEEGDRSVVAVGLFLSRPLPIGRKYLYAPYGPVVRDNVSGDVWNGVLTQMRQKLQSVTRPAPVFIRVEPKESVAVAQDVLLHANLRVKGYGVQPKDTLVLDLNKTEEEILAECKQKTRYNIRLASRQGVTVREDTSPEGLKAFLHLAEDVQRQGVFRYHKASYYRHMLETLGKNMLSLLIAEHEGEALAAGLFMRYGTSMTYAHGASTRKKSNVMAPHALHWEAIKAAKEKGCKQYDFFGVAPSKSPSHSWSGISRFKRGFGGEEHSYVGIADAILDRTWYELFAIGRVLRGVVQ